MARVKICGITTVADALACARIGVDSVGLNFVPESPRCIDRTTARSIVQAVRDATGVNILVVGVVAGLSIEAMVALREATGVGCLQLHGDESVDDLGGVLPHAYKAVRVSTPDDVKHAASMPGEYVMVDARIEGARGGTGHRFDWSLVVSLAQTRKLVLAGGLTPENVAGAIATVRPWCVDVASGVETAPGRKDLGKVRAFVEASREKPPTPT